MKRHLMPTLRCFTLQLLLTASVGLTSAASGQDAGVRCEPFRHGPLVTERIRHVDIRGPDLEVLAPIELHYDPDYLSKPWLPPLRPDRMERAGLFKLNALTGAPLDDSEQRNNPPTQTGTITILVMGKQSVVPLNEIIFSRADAPPGSSFEATNERLGSYTMLEIPAGRQTAPFTDRGVDVFASFDPMGNVKSVLNCDRQDAQPNPQCSISFETAVLNVKVLEIGRAEVQTIGEIAQTARDFAWCLTNDK